MARYLYIKDNQPPQYCSESVLLDCFAFCNGSIKRDLRHFIEDEKRKRITFKFERDQVRIVRLRRDKRKEK